MEVQDKLTEYVELFEKAREKVGDNLVAMGIVDQIGRDLRAERIEASRPARRGPDASQLATERQLALLAELGVVIPETAQVSKSRASQMIDEAIAERDSVALRMPRPVP